MWKFDHHRTSDQIKEMLYFYNTIDNLPEPKSKDRTPISDEGGIPVILSADDNYACFIATTGASILYNTNSFIKFYIISEGITDKNKAIIENTFFSITPNFSIKFLECDSTKEFSQIKLPENYHVKLNTCNRLLFPRLAPEVDRAVYLDVDLIVMGDIKDLWEEDLEGKIIGAVPLLYDRCHLVSYLRNKAGIPDDNKYKYYNSGVMLIDYAQWRKCKIDNNGIINNIFEILENMNADVTPDELILNKFSYENGWYKLLKHRYNVNPFYCYSYLSKNKNRLNHYEKKTLEEFNDFISKYGYKEISKLNEEPIVRHFYGHEKPWTHVKQTYFPMPYIEHFEDFWFYAKMTPYYKKIKMMFLSNKLESAFYYDDSKKKNKKYIKYKLLNKITFGLFPEIKKRVEKYRVLSGN